MRDSHRLMFGFLVARLAFGAAFLASAVARWPVLWYFPLEHRWQWAASGSGVAMDWYGRSALGIASGAVFGFVAYLATSVRQVARYVSRRAVVLGVAHLGALLLLNDVVFYVLTLSLRHVTPQPVPAWYCPG